MGESETIDLSQKEFDYAYLYALRACPQLIMNDMLGWIVCPMGKMDPANEEAMGLLMGARTIYYCGTEEQFEAETEGYGPVEFTAFFYSETEPTTEGNYWHYVDGVPTAW